MTTQIAGTELARNANRKSCWLLIDGTVYDVAPFLATHPGGAGVLLAAAGGDATQSFKDVGHSAGAIAKMAQFQIGKLAAGTSKISVGEVAKHNKEGDAYVIIRGCVYNVSAFLQDHPGGVEILLDETGKDATSAFDSVGHSEAAKHTLAGFFMGIAEGRVEASVGGSKVNARYNVAPKANTAAVAPLAPTGSPVPIEGKTTALTYIAALVAILLLVVLIFS